MKGCFSWAMEEPRSAMVSDPLVAAAAQEQEEDARWAPSFLHECAKAMAQKDIPAAQHYMWILNELASPYGDLDQRIASCFMQALFCRLTGTGSRCYKILCAAAERSYSFDSMRQMILRFQEANPWTTFGHVAANGAILEAFEKEMNIHIIDLSNTFCTQWPTLLEALATRHEGAPNLLRITTVVASREISAVNVMTEIGNRLQKFARLMGVPFEFKAVHESELQKLQPSDFRLRSGEALAVNCIQSLHLLPENGGSTLPSRNGFLDMIRSMNPKIMTVVEEEANLVSTDFLHCVTECVRFQSLFFESLEESFPRTSNERLMLERIASRRVVGMLACEESEDLERQERCVQWSSRIRRAGFVPAFHSPSSSSSFSADVIDDVRALLKRYKHGWGFLTLDNSLFLTWKDQPVLFASAWTP